MDYLQVPLALGALIMTLEQKEILTKYRQRKSEEKEPDYWMYTAFVFAFVFVLHSFYIGYIQQKETNNNGRIQEQNQCGPNKDSNSKQRANLAAR